MKEDWAEQLRNKLNGHEKSAPEGLWKSIDESMSGAGKPARGIVPLRLLAFAAAASLLLLVGLFLSEDTDNDEAQKISRSHVSPVRHSVEEGVSVQEGGREHIVAQNTVEEAIPLIESDTVSYSGNVPTDTAASEPVPDRKSHAKHKRTSLPDMGGRDTRLVAANTLGGKLSFGLGGSFGLASLNSGGAGNGGGELIASFSPFSNDSVIRDTTLVRRNVSHVHRAPVRDGSFCIPVNVRHRMPIRLGIDIRYRLSSRWAVESGVFYTRLSNDYTLVSAQGMRNVEQTLHYIGIPLNVSFRIWSSRYLSAYFSCGGTFSKCISVQQPDNVEIFGVDKDERPVQWSVNASVGAEFRIVPRLSVYMEPTIGYYFKDHSTLEHYYKEHPLSGGLNLGLRYSFGR